MAWFLLLFAKVSLSVYIVIKCIADSNRFLIISPCFQVHPGQGVNNMDKRLYQWAVAQSPETRPTHPPLLPRICWTTAKRIVSCNNTNTEIQGSHPLIRLQDLHPLIRLHLISVITTIGAARHAHLRRLK